MQLHNPGRNVACAFALALAVCSISPAVSAQAQKRDLNSAQVRLAREVRHELLLIPSYSLFDDLEFEIKGLSTIVLLGQVTRPSLKSDAESTVLGLEGVGKIINKIEVLPLSPADERIRWAAYHAIFSKPGLDRYAIRAVPPIHIIVKDGNITLMGTVANEADKYQAEVAVKEVPGTLSVTDSLKIEKK